MDFPNVSWKISLRCLVLAFLTVNSVYCRSFMESSDYLGDFNQETRYAKIQAALGKLEHAPQWVPDWPNPSVKMGQVSGVAIDNKGLVLVFHRASHVWDMNTFTSRDVYQDIGGPAIPHPTILIFNKTGELVDMWGQNLFYMPHGITVDKEGNVWVTDVAMHQVFKFTPENRLKPAMVLGDKFVPGNDNSHFCKPSAVAVTSSGDFFVADGYCNSRIIKYSSDGTMILEWGKFMGDSPYVLNVPHALTLAEDKGAICVADREHGRVTCFRLSDGGFLYTYASWLFGRRLFSVAYSPVKGGRLYVVNGPGGGPPVRGFVLSFPAGALLQTFDTRAGLANPHDIAVSQDGREVYVAELNPYRAYKFVDESLGANATAAERSVTKTTLVPVKPTTTNVVEWGGWWRGGWRGAAGGAAAALGAAALLGAALALSTAKGQGRKSVPRRRWEYGQGEFKLRRLLDRRRFTRVQSEDSEDEPAPMLPPQSPATA